MQDAPDTRDDAADRQPRAHEARATGRRVLGLAVFAALTAAGCGLKGSLTLPEKPGNVVIRPGPGQQAPAPAPVPEVEPLPPPELPPDTRGNTRG
jgi:hypothetical protein